jgi:hypothetical protein
MHAMRIAVKKLRYSVELAEQTGLWRPPRLLRDLRRIQATLGELHDAQVLLDRLRALLPRETVATREHALLASALHADVDGYYHDYLATRDRLRAICVACLRFTGKAARQSAWVPPRPVVVASAVAVPAGLFLAAGRRATVTVLRPARTDTAQPDSHRRDGEIAPMRRSQLVSTRRS